MLLYNSFNEEVGLFGPPDDIESLEVLHMVANYGLDFKTRLRIPFAASRTGLKLAASRTTDGVIGLIHHIRRRVSLA